MPRSPHTTPIPLASSSMRGKLSVSSRAVTAGTTRMAAIMVTPRIWIEAMTVAARINDSKASTPRSGTP